MIFASRNTIGALRSGARSRICQLEWRRRYVATPPVARPKFRRYVILGATVVGAWAVASYLFQQQIKETIARLLGNYITKNSRFTVVFEEASVLPGWNQLNFKKCFISRRPELKKKFVKGSQQEAVEASETAVSGDVDDGNYTQYDLTINEINLTISLFKWFNGKGILKDAELKGVRGVVDRTHVHWAKDDDPRNYLNVPGVNDFNIENFKIDDLMVTLCQPENFRPFNISIYNCNLGRGLRQNWLFIDFLNADNINGSYDGSLFTIHKLHEHGKELTRCRIDGLNVDHLNTGVDGPLSWIVNGNVDMVGDMRIPQSGQHNVDEYFHEVVKEIFSRGLRSPYETEYNVCYQPGDSVELKLKLKLNNVKANIPMLEISYLKYALMRPIVGYINSRQTFVAIKCNVVKLMKDFNGSWTMYDSLLMEEISNLVYQEFENYVIDEDQTNIRLRKIGFWSLQLIFQVFLFGLGSIG